MLKELIKTKIFPSPLLLETIHQEDWMRQITYFALCEKESACGLCFQCKQIKNGYHPDWLSLSGKSSIEDLRTTLAQLRKKPFQSKRRVLSIHEMGASNRFFQNALLKTLEEPEPYWILVLGVRSIYSLLETIRSRCLVFRDPIELQEEKLEGFENELYLQMTEGQHIEAFQNLEILFKDRQKTKKTMMKLLKQASKDFYPGAWIKLAPELEAQLEFYDRNIHAKTIWGKVSSRTF